MTKEPLIGILLMPQGEALVYLLCVYFKDSVSPLG